MKKKILLLLSFSFLLTGITSCNPGQEDIDDNPKDTLPVLPEAEGALQEFFDSLRHNNFTISYVDSYAAQGVERAQMSYYTDYSLQSEGDLGFNGYAQNDECVFSYNLENGEVISGLPVVDYNAGIMVSDIYDYRDGMQNFDYTFLPKNYTPGQTFTYTFGQNTLNDELLISVFLRMTYNPNALPKSLTMSLVNNTLRVDCVSNYYEIQDAYDRSSVTVYDVGKTENPEIKKYLEDGKTSKTPLDRRFYELIAPYLESNNYLTTLDATGLRNDAGGYETFKENQYFLEDAVIYEAKDGSGKVSGDLQIPGAVVNFSLDSMDDKELEITQTPSNQGEGPYTYLYGEYISYILSSMGFSNFIGYIDEENKDSYYITDSQAQSILAYICKYELDTTERALRSLRLQVDDWDKHEFTLYFDVYNPTTSLSRGIYKASFSEINNVRSEAVERYLNIGEDPKNQDIKTLETVLNKFKGHKYSMDVLTDAGLAKVYYTPDYYFIQTYGVPSSNEGFIKQGDSIYEFTISYNTNNQITGINIDDSRDYADLGMTLPGCGRYNGDPNTDLFYFSAFDDVIYDFSEGNYTQDSIMGYHYWKNNGSVSNGTLFSQAVLRYFYPNDTSGALPQGAGFMVSDGEDPYDTRVSLFLAYSSADGLNYGGQYTTFYDIGGTGFEYLDNYIEQNN